MVTGTNFLAASLDGLEQLQAEGNAILCGIADREQLLLTNERRRFEQKLGSRADDSDEVGQFVGNFLDASCTQGADAVDVFRREVTWCGIGRSGRGIARWRREVRVGAVFLLH